jgi:hypothetical protein
MRNINTRAVAAAVCGAAFVGAMFAGSPIDAIGNNTGGAGNNAVPAVGAPQLPAVANGLTNVQAPNIAGVAYVTKKHNDLNCKPLSGNTKLPIGHNTNVDHPVQCKDDSVARGKAQIAGINL